MTTTPANHYILVGSIDGIIDTSGPGGQPVVSIRLDGTPLENAELRDGEDGIEVTALVEQVPDLRTVRLRLIIPRVNVGADATLFAGVVIFSVLIACGVAPLPRDPLGVFLPCIVLLLLGLGTGTLAAFTFPLSSVFGIIFRILLRILHITAAISFFGRALPPRLLEWALWNPVYHGVELFREAYFDIHSNPQVSFWYPSAWAAGLFLLGIAIERVAHAELDEEKPEDIEQTAALESSLI